MKRLLTSSLLLLAVAAFVVAQSEPLNCSDLSVSGPSALVDPGEVDIFRIVLEPDIDESKLKIKWTVEHGSIVNGQGTKSIGVLRESKESAPVATAVVTGPGNCSWAATGTGIPWDPPSPVLIAEFGELSEDELLAEVENMIENLNSRQNATAHVITYGTNNEVQSLIERFRELIRCIDCYPAGSIGIVNGGLDKNDETVHRTRIWIVPAGADASEID